MLRMGKARRTDDPVCQVDEKDHTHYDHVHEPWPVSVTVTLTVAIFVTMIVNGVRHTNNSVCHYSNQHLLHHFQSHICDQWVKRRDAKSSLNSTDANLPPKNSTVK